MSKLKERRKAAGMSQAELAKETGVNVRMIQYYEQGVKDINQAAVTTVIKIADALGCDVRQIIED